MKNVVRVMMLLTMTVIVNACSNDDDGPNVLVLETKEAFVANYVDIVYASYLDAYNETVKMQDAIESFVADPDASKFEAAKDAWLAAREPYGQTEVYRFYDGPIDGEDGEPEGYINAWPLDEGMIDYVAGTEDVGENIVNNDTEYPEITEQVLRDGSGFGNNESNVTIGYHAVEFLLWGQDLTAPSAKMNGQREFTDYTTADNADRRKTYLAVSTQILVEDLKSVLDQWATSGAYRAEFLAYDADVAIDKILTGAAKLSKGELAGERMATAVENQDQEDEHSCFSDNTHRDIFLNAQAINNVITGTYVRVDGSSVTGTSLLEILTLVNAEDAITLTATAAEVMTKVSVISTTRYFDFLIIGETLDNTSKPVMSTVSSLRTQGDQLAQAGKTLTGQDIDPSV